MLLCSHPTFIVSSMNVYILSSSWFLRGLKCTWKVLDDSRERGTPKRSASDQQQTRIWRALCTYSSTHKRALNVPHEAEVSTCKLYSVERKGGGKSLSESARFCLNTTMKEGLPPQTTRSCGGGEGKKAERRRRGANCSSLQNCARSRAWTGGIRR